MTTEATAALLWDVIRREAQPAVGCTEPAMVAMAAARARAVTGERPRSVRVRVSPGVFKNGWAVGLPHTRLTGLDIAAAMGALGGDPEGGLQVLGRIRPKAAGEAADMVRAQRVTVACDGKRDGLFAHVSVETERHVGEAVIEGSHTNLTRLAVDGRDLPAEASGAAGDRRPGLESLRGLEFAELYEAALAVDLKPASYLVDGACSVEDLARRVLLGECEEASPGMGRTLGRLVDQRVMCDDLVTQVRLGTAAAVSARMGGVLWPVLTSAGSGNQGILVALPVLLTARALGLDGPAAAVHRGDGRVGRRPDGRGADGGERLARALVLAHAVNVYLKSFAGEISALCGSVTGGAGVAAAVCWLLGGQRDQIEGAIVNLVSGLYGMVCDGAKASCALKIATGAAEGVIAGQLARQGAVLKHGNGLVGESVGEVTRALGLGVRLVLREVDRLLVDLVAGGVPPGKG